MRPLKIFEKNYCNSDDEVVIKNIFARRHKVCGIFFVGSFFLVFALHFFAIDVFGFSEQDYASSGLGEFTYLLFFISGIYALFKYRCPRCNTSPTSGKPGTSGVLLFPKKCGNCGAPLLPDHPWAQD